MSATLRVVHSTGYQYQDGATSSYNEARMTPRTDSEQTVLHSRLEITPAAWTHTYLDYWGTSVTAFELHERHEELRVVATSTVDIDRTTELEPPVGWDVLRSDRVASDFAEYLNPGRLVTPADGLAELVTELVAASSSPTRLVDDVRDLVRERIAYVPGVTSVQTTATEVWENGAGVCQDLSHLLVGALRAGGVPARYVSGYLMADSDAPIGEPTSGQSHAWVEYWTGAWQGLDPTNVGEVGDHHVVVGHGRDYSDVAPLRGIFTGGPAGDMYVEVTVSRLR